MTEPLRYPERVAIARLHALLEILPTALDHRLAPAGITSFEFTLLEALAEAPENFLRLTALATKTNATLPRLSRVVTSLERKGFVERRTCPADRRANNAFLTEEGRACYHASEPLYAAATRELILDGLGEVDGDGVEQLATICLAVLRHIDPERRLAVTCDSPASDAIECAEGFEELDTAVKGCCAADPVEALSADPTVVCPADPAPSCPADPAPTVSSPARS